MNPIDTHDPAFQDFVVHNIPVFMLMVMMEQYRLYLKTLADDSITEEEIARFDNMLKKNKTWGDE